MGKKRVSSTIGEFKLPKREDKAETRAQIYERLTAMGWSQRGIDCELKRLYAEGKLKTTWFLGHDVQGRNYWFAAHYIED